MTNQFIFQCCTLAQMTDLITCPYTTSQSRRIANILTPVYHRTWAGSREMFDKIGNAWVRKLKACVAAKKRFLPAAQNHRTAQRPAHLAIGVSQVTPLLWNPHLCFQQVIFSGSHFMPHALLFLHHAVVLHPKTNRNASRTGTSPSFSAQAIVFQTFSAHILPMVADPFSSTWFAAYVQCVLCKATHSSPGCILGLKVKRRIFVSQRCTVRALQIFHVQFALLFSAVLKTWLTTRWHFVAKETLFERLISAATHQFAQCLFDPLCAFPITLKTAHQHLEDLPERQFPIFPPSPPPTWSVSSPSSSYELVHHSDSRLGSMSKFNSSSMISFTIWANISRLLQNNQYLSAHIILRKTYSLSDTSPNEKPHPLAFHLSSAFQSTYLATRSHNTIPSTPPCRMRLEQRNSVSQFSKHADPFTSCISASKAATT